MQHALRDVDTLTAEGDAMTMTETEKHRQFFRIFMKGSKEGYWCATLSEPMPIRIPEDEQVQRLFKHAVIADCNGAFAAMYGFSTPEELLNTPLLAFVTREERKNRETLQAFIRAGYALRDAVTNETDKHGNPRWFTNHAEGVVEDDQLVSIWGHQSDITDKVRREQDRDAFLQKLSTRQKLILSLLLENYSLKEVARILRITYNTAHTHCYRRVKHFEHSDVPSLLHHARHLAVTGNLSLTPDSLARTLGNSPR